MLESHSSERLFADKGGRLAEDGYFGVTHPPKSVHLRVVGPFRHAGLQTGQFRGIPASKSAGKNTSLFEYAFKMSVTVPYSADGETNTH